MHKDSLERILVNHAKKYLSPTGKPIWIYSIPKRAANYFFGFFCIFFVMFLFQFAFVIPIFGEMFTDFGKELPRPTQIVFDLLRFTSDNLVLCLLLLILFLYGVFATFRELERMKEYLLMDLLGLTPVGLIGLVFALMFLPIFQLP